MTEIIKSKVTILKQLGIWEKLPSTEKTRFKACTTERQLTNMQVTFRHKYM